MSEWVNMAGVAVGDCIASNTQAARRRHLRNRRIGRVLAALAVACPIAFALFQAPRQGAGPGSERVGVDRKGGIIGRDDRKLLSDFAMPEASDQRALRAGLRATQYLSCGYGSASLVYRSDVIVFAAHELLDDDKPDPAIASCAFEVVRVENGETVVDRYPLLRDTIEIGDLPGKPWTEGNVQDWGVARVARPVPDIVPYGLPRPGDVDAPGTPVVAVSTGTDNWTGPDDRGATTRLAEACKTVEADPDLGGDRGVMHLDCDVGKGASGGALLTDAASGHPRDLGTIVAYSGSGCSSPGHDTCFSIGRRLDPDLVARIRGTTALGTPEDAPFAAAQRARLQKPRDAVAAAALAALARPFPARDDAVGQAVADLYRRIRVLDRDRRPEEAEALLLEAFETLKDPDRHRPEWTWLLMESGRQLADRGRLADAYQSFRMADSVAPDALKPALRLRMALCTTEPSQRTRALGQAYLASGEGLFRAFDAERDLAAIEARGVPSEIADGDDD